MKRQYLPMILVGALSLFVYACSDSGDPVGPGNTVSTINVSDVTVVEGDTAVFIVSLNGAPDSSTVTFQYSTVNGTAVGGTDFVGVVTANGSIPNGSSSVTVKVATINNTLTDGTRLFTLQLSTVVGITVGDAIGQGSITDDEVPGVSYATQVKPILSLRCSIQFCHGSGSSAGGYTMGAGAPYNTVRNAAGLNGPIIVAGNASSSNIYLKTTITPPFGLQMPLSGPKLSISEQQLIRDWINGGALDN